MVQGRRRYQQCDSEMKKTASDKTSTWPAWPKPIFAVHCKSQVVQSKKHMELKHFQGEYKIRNHTADRPVWHNYQT